MTATENRVQINWTKVTRNALALLGFVLVMYILAHVTHLIASPRTFTTKQGMNPSKVK